MTIEHRTFRNMEVRAAPEPGPNGRPVVELRAITPGVVDDYGSLWMANTFDKRMRERTAADSHDTPTLCWAHDWSDPIGHGIAYKASKDGPRVSFELDDFDAVPRARQAAAQVESHTIRDCSVGFSHTQRRDPTDDEIAKHPNIREVIEGADLDEVSLVLAGAVPGAKVLSLRSKGGTREVPAELLEDLGRKIAAGTLTHAEADAIMDLAAGQAPESVTELVVESDDGSSVLADDVLESMGF